MTNGGPFGGEPTQGGWERRSPVDRPAHTTGRTTLGKACESAAEGTSPGVPALVVKDRVRVSHDPSVHGIVHRIFRAQGIEWASVHLPDTRVGYAGRTVNHPVQVLAIVDDDPPGWVYPEDRR